MQNNLKNNFYKKKIVVTGHTGFKGSWLTLWLKTYGANIMGISNEILTNPNHFKELKIRENINDKKLNIKNLKKLKKTILNFKPDYIFHFAAQSIVSKSYEDPIGTWETNTMGTLNILETLRTFKHNCVAVIITSDKSYRNFEIKRGYLENDILGGNDPYGGSKAAAEIGIRIYFESFLKNKKNIKIGVARAGNVIGGGDWTNNRLIPDCIRGWSKNRPVIIRSLKSTRPWQHVLEAIYGYMIFACRLRKNSLLNGHAFNFGPKNRNDYSVNSVLLQAQKNWKNAKWVFKKKHKNFVESNLLKLNSNKAKKYLNWECGLNFNETIDMTINWYKNFYNKKYKRVLDISIDDIKYYKKKLKIL